MVPEEVRRRRRGAALEAAVLDAAWSELAERGYADLTVDAVAARAGTSKAVLYRRWPGKPELAKAAVAHVLAQNPVAVPDTGNLRDDVVALLRQANERRLGIAVHLVAALGEFFRQTGTTLGGLRESLLAGHVSGMTQVLDRAVERGEIPPDRLTERIARLPADLMRHELLMTSGPVADEAIVEIVDTIFLPLVRP